MNGNNPRQADNGNAQQEPERVSLEKRYGSIGCAAVKAATMVSSKKPANAQDRFRPKAVRDHD